MKSGLGLVCGVCSFSSRGFLRDLRGIQGVQEDNKVSTKDSIRTMLRHTHMRCVCDPHDVACYF